MPFIKGIMMPSVMPWFLKASCYFSVMPLIFIDGIIKKGIKKGITKPDNNIGCFEGVVVTVILIWKKKV